MTILPDPAVHRLAGVIARDVDELLTIIIGYAELTMGSNGGLGPEAGDDLRVVQAAGQRARALTSRLHTLGGRRVVRREPVDLAAALRQLLPRLEDAAGPDVAIDLQPAAVPATLVDVELLEQALREVVTNAAEALDGRGTVTVALRPTTRAVGGAAAAIAVTDGGRGMAPAVLARCRQPLFSTKPAGSGAGLGLAIADAAVRQVGGELHLRSVPGGGTTVTVVLPGPETEAAGGDQGSKR